MKIQRTSAGSAAVNKLFEGGYENDVLTTIYGPAGSGKTTMAMMCAISVANSGKKTVFIDTEGGFSIERFRQLSSNDKEIMKNILILKPMNFREQMKTVHNLSKKINERVGLVVIDTISMLYRVEVSATRDVKQVNNELGLQIAWLVEIARKHKIPVIATNQVYSDFENKDKVKMVGGDILRYSSKCLVELMNYLNKRKAVLVKHRSLPERKSIVFEIVEAGFKEVK
jgi:DNA repair protein RadB